MTTDLLPDTGEAAEKFKRGLADIFNRIFENRSTIPDAIISSVHSAGYAEDGSFLLMLDCSDSIMFVTATPGEPLRVCVQQHPH